MEEPVRRSRWSWGLCQDLTARDMKNQSRFTAWAIAWSLSFGLATVVLAGEWITSRPLAVALALIPTFIGVAAFAAYATFIRQADEMIRMIQLESLALGFGAGTLFMLGYRLFERIGAPQLDTSDALVVMLFVWAGAQAVLSRRYT